MNKDVPKLWFPILKIPSKNPFVRWFHPVSINWDDEYLILEHKFFGLSLSDESTTLSMINSVGRRSTWFDVLMLYRTQTIIVHSRDDMLPIVRIKNIRKGKPADKLYELLVAYTDAKMVKFES